MISATCHEEHGIWYPYRLGAQTNDVLRLILKYAIVLVLVGIGIGLAAALALTRVMKSLLFGVGPTDVATLATVSLSLVFVALIACYLPARRAMKVDPLVALRHE